MPFNPYAFPSNERDINEGISLRDYFAAKAMQGIVTTDIGTPRYSPAIVAQWSYELSDAMLAEREKPQEGK